MEEMLYAAVLAADAWCFWWAFAVPFRDWRRIRDRAAALDYFALALELDGDLEREEFQKLYAALREMKEAD